MFLWYLCLLGGGRHLIARNFVWWAVEDIFFGIIPLWWLVEDISKCIPPFGWRCKAFLYLYLRVVYSGV